MCRPTGPQSFSSRQMHQAGGVAVHVGRTDGSNVHAWNSVWNDKSIAVKELLPILLAIAM